MPSSGLVAGSQFRVLVTSVDTQMHEQQIERMESLATWVQGLGADVSALAEVLESNRAPTGARQLAGRCLKYWAWSDELGAAGIEDLRLVDLAVVFRTLADFSVVSADLTASEENPGLEGASSTQEVLPPLAIVERLGGGAQTVRELLGEDYGALARFSSDLLEPTAPQGEATDWLENAEVRELLVEKAKKWAAEYLPPAREEDENALIKVRAFFRTKLVE